MPPACDGCEWIICCWTCLDKEYNACNDPRKCEKVEEWYK